MSNQEEMWCCHETFRAGKAMLTGCAEGVSDHCCHSDVASAEPCVAGMWAWNQPRSPVSLRCLPEQCNRVKPFGLRVPWSTFGTNSQPMRQRPFTLPCIPWCLHPELGGATEDGERPAGEKHHGARADGQQVGVLLLGVCVSRGQHSYSGFPK